MSPLMQSQVFFFISSIGFVILAILAVIVLIYLILLLRRWYRLTKAVESQVHTVGAEVRTILNRFLESRILSWLVGKGRMKKK